MNADNIDELILDNIIAKIRANAIILLYLHEFRETFMEWSELS